MQDSACPVTDEVNFDILINMVPTRFLYCKVTPFPNVINKVFFVGRRLVKHYVK